MFYTLENKCIDEINVVKIMIDNHERLSKQHAQLTNQIKFFSVSSCVTRLYAIYENFVETAISDYLDTLSECVTFASLSEEFKTEYRLGISIILSKIDQGRYDHLNHENIIKWYYEAISNAATYKFISQALTRHEQNLRLNIVEQLLAKIQVKDLKAWLNNHTLIKELYDDHTALFEQLESEMKNFIQLRNDAAHGTLSSLESKDNLFRLCDLNIAVIKSIGSYFRKFSLSHLTNSGRMNEIGVVSESFGRNGAFVALVKRGTHLKLGREIYFLSNNNCFKQSINSMRINDISVPGITTKINDLEVGIKCANPVKVGTRIFLY